MSSSYSLSLQNQLNTGLGSKKGLGSGILDHVVSKEAPDWPGWLCPQREFSRLHQLHLLSQTPPSPAWQSQNDGNQLLSLLLFSYGHFGHGRCQVSELHQLGKDPAVVLLHSLPQVVDSHFDHCHAILVLKVLQHFRVKLFPPTNTVRIQFAHKAVTLNAYL
ncbi:hypothetical protein PanWU01x14_055680 [Parasponia andersonii]|uniref:Uncharacterized protein n=1 Tax=Parasponia andersonii TaxID=3476 RepID=A0A2P5DK80_PARAD|nr:hypothetical protein PanWU01x14_055680 [Parasponia andersonii]